MRKFMKYFKLIKYNMGKGWLWGACLFTCIMSFLFYNICYGDFGAYLLGILLMVTCLFILEGMIDNILTSSLVQSSSKKGYMSVKLLNIYSMISIGVLSVFMVAGEVIKMYYFDNSESLCVIRLLVGSVYAVLLIIFFTTGKKVKIMNLFAIITAGSLGICGAWLEDNSAKLYPFVPNNLELGIVIMFFIMSICGILVIFIRKANYKKSYPERYYKIYDVK